MAHLLQSIDQACQPVEEQSHGAASSNFSADTATTGQGQLLPESDQLGEKKMRTELLAEELADFWLPVLTQQSWEQRNETLSEIHDQLYEDVEQDKVYRAVSPWLLAGIIHRLGEPPVDQLAQAQIYAGSLDLRHREAAHLWHERHSPVMVASTEEGSSNYAERRRAPRYLIDQPSRLRTDDPQLEIECQLRDISRDGVGIVFDRPLPAPDNHKLQIALPGGEWRLAQMVYITAVGCGLILQAAV